VTDATEGTEPQVGNSHALYLTVSYKDIALLSILQQYKTSPITASIHQPPNIKSGIQQRPNYIRNDISYRFQHTFSTQLGGPETSNVYAAQLHRTTTTSATMTVNVPWTPIEYRGLIDPRPHRPSSGRSPKRPRPEKPIQPRDDGASRLAACGGNDNGPQPRDPGNGRTFAITPQPRDDGKHGCFSSKPERPPPKDVQPRDGGKKRRTERREVQPRDPGI